MVARGNTAVRPAPLSDQVCCRGALQPAVARSVWYRPISSGDSGPLFLRPACGLSWLGGDIGLDGGHSLVRLALPFPMGRMARNLAEWLGSGGVPDRFPRVALLHHATSYAASGQAASNLLQPPDPAS